MDLFCAAVNAALFQQVHIRGLFMAVHRLQLRLFCFAFALALLAAIPPVVKVVAAPPAPIELPITQPDGSVIQVRQWGDEWQHGYETTDGYTLIQDSSSGTWLYAARQSDGSLAAAQSAEGAALVAGRDNPGQLARHARPAPSLRALAQQQARESELTAASFTGNQGTQPVLVVLVYFNNRSYTYPAADFQQKFFGAGTKSVQEFYGVASHHHLTMSAASETYGANDGIVGWVQLPQSHPNDTNQGPQLVYNALSNSAVNNVVNFAAFDSNNDGYISNSELHIILVVAGYEDSYADHSGPGMWAHQFSLSEAGLSLMLDGKWIGDADHDGGYALFGEIHGAGTTSSTNPLYNDHEATMGVMAHEMGHTLAWPDLYDVSNLSEGVGDWSIMGGGSWNGLTYPGDTPALPDAWSKYYQRWITPTQAVSGHSYSLVDAASNPSALLVGSNPGGVDWVFQNNSGSGDYFLVENREQASASFDQALPGCGLLIWHIDESVTSSNQANGDRDHPLVRLMQADGTNDLYMALNRGDEGDPFPGLSNNTEFSYFTNPNSRLYHPTATGDRMRMNTAGCASSMSLAYDITQTAIQQVFLPAVSRTLPTFPFTGTVTQNNQAASGVTVRLAYSTDGGDTYDGEYDRTVTDSSGKYRFNAPILSGDEQFVVYFVNEDIDHERLHEFDCNAVKAGSSQTSCSFDIGEALVRGPSQVYVDPPCTFSWYRRPISSDSYRVIIWSYDETYNVFQAVDYSELLGYVNYFFVLDFPWSTMSVGPYYYWDLYIYTPSGVGESTSMGVFALTSLSGPSRDGERQKGGTLHPGAPDRAPMFARR
jgi:M6 family metalloprotease-like protein